MTFKEWLAAQEVMSQGAFVDENRPPTKGPYYEPQLGPVLHGKCGCRQHKKQKKV